MSTLIANRIHSAYPRTIRRSPANIQLPHVKQRPISSLATRRFHTDKFEVPEWRTSAVSTPSGELSSGQRPNTASRSSISNTSFPARQLRSNEVDSLLQSLDRDETFTVQVDCLANYRTLVQTINLRRTPIHWKALRALQQRENQIIQRNACGDRRFRLLLGSLHPTHPLAVKGTENKRNHLPNY